ncbi:hypothetical protein SRB5_59640 [Streptomyces sp. RB5]|uniref:Uncharacterized protein n=1 Tax=Streptomyces smaragdinus TaxID=2585196 RepID=A0A7K0CR21_9ACTN|nr:hypothetical protein [Streptomyces smaragdinus]MQY15773.1 hypothetical protein [Streptomyces smaragdinus]
MSGERSVSDAPPIVFARAWCGTDLGEYRPCRSTYERYPYEGLPRIDPADFTGADRRLAGSGEVVPELAVELGELAEGLEAKGVTLPQDFVTFQTDSKLYRLLDEISVTACSTHISEPLPSPVEPDAYLVRFLRDQQDCVIWYLYLRPSGESFVVHSHLDYEYEYEARRAGEDTGTDLDDLEEQQSAILWCAPSFTEFAYRFWAENRLWRALNDDALSGLGPGTRAYLNHYAPRPPTEFDREAKTSLRWGVASVAVWLFPYWVLSSLIAIPLGMAGACKAFIVYRRADPTERRSGRLLAGFLLSALSGGAAIAYWVFLFRHPELLVRD